MNIQNEVHNHESERPYRMNLNDSAEETRSTSRQVKLYLVPRLRIPPLVINCFIGSSPRRDQLPIVVQAIVGSSRSSSLGWEAFDGRRQSCSTGSMLSTVNMSIKYNHRTLLTRAGRTCTFHLKIWPRCGAQAEGKVQGPCRWSSLHCPLTLNGSVCIGSS